MISKIYNHFFIKPRILKFTKKNHPIYKSTYIFKIILILKQKYINVYRKLISNESDKFIFIKSSLKQKCLECMNINHLFVLYFANTHIHYFAKKSFKLY